MGETCAGKQLGERPRGCGALGRQPLGWAALPLGCPQLSCLPWGLTAGITLFEAWLLGGQLGRERGFLTGAGAYF